MGKRLIILCIMQIRYSILQVEAYASYIYYCMSYICKGGMNVVGYISSHNDSPHVSYDVIVM